MLKNEHFGGDMGGVVSMISSYSRRQMPSVSAFKKVEASSHVQLC